MAWIIYDLTLSHIPFVSFFWYSIASGGLQPSARGNARGTSAAAARANTFKCASPAIANCDQWGAFTGHHQISELRCARIRTRITITFRGSYCDCSRRGGEQRRGRLSSAKIVGTRKLEGTIQTRTGNDGLHKAHRTTSILHGVKIINCGAEQTSEVSSIQQQHHKQQQHQQQQKPNVIGDGNIGGSGYIWWKRYSW